MSSGIGFALQEVSIPIFLFVHIAHINDKASCNASRKLKYEMCGMMIIDNDKDE